MEEISIFSIVINFPQEMKVKNLTLKDLFQDLQGFYTPIGGKDLPYRSKKGASPESFYEKKGKNHIYFNYFQDFEDF